jgi:hypothetical protein
MLTLDKFVLRACEDDASCFSVRDDGLQLCEIHRLSESRHKRWQIVSPWGPETFDDEQMIEKLCQLSAKNEVKKVLTDSFSDAIFEE